MFNVECNLKDNPSAQVACPFGVWKLLSWKLSNWKRRCSLWIAQNTTRLYIIYIQDRETSEVHSIILDVIRNGSFFFRLRNKKSFTEVCDTFKFCIGSSENNKLIQLFYFTAKIFVNRYFIFLTWSTRVDISLRCSFILRNQSRSPQFNVLSRKIFYKCICTAAFT